MLTFSFHETAKDDVPHVTVHLGSMQWGDPLNDNSRVEDFYRYHDIFHLGLYALTGWSPVTEHFLKAKTDPRQEMLEEALSIVAFSEAKKKGFFTEEKPSADFLKRFQGMAEYMPYSLTDKTTVYKMSEQEWSDTLVDIYGVFSQLKTNRGGKVSLDPATRQFDYLPL
jgi:hypothetical protein